MPDAVDGRADSVRRALDEFLDRLAEAVVEGIVGPPAAPPVEKGAAASPADPENDG